MQHMNSSGLSNQLNSAAKNNRLQGTPNRAIARPGAPEAERSARAQIVAVGKLVIC
jgi:hypothetical protein